MPTYTAVRKTSGRPQVDRMISKKAIDHFGLYGSIVFGSEDGAPAEVLAAENQDLRWDLAKLQDEVSTWDSASEVLAQDAKR